LKLKLEILQRKKTVLGLKMSTIEILYCESEKVFEQLEPAIKISKPLATCILHYGERILNDRRTVISDIEGKYKRIDGEWWRLAKEEVGEILRKFDEKVWWINLSKKLDDFDEFYSCVSWGETGYMPKITREKAKELIESFGSPQLKKYLEGEKSKAEVEIASILESYHSTLEMIGKLNKEIENTKNLIEELKGFDSLLLDVEKVQPGYKVDKGLLEKLAERKASSKAGVNLKIVD